MKGFTLVETLVVVSILTLLTSMVILYNRAGERQIVLLREKAQLMSTLLRAKSLALNVFVEDEFPCGYGVHFTEGKYFMYRDKALQCRTSDHTYSEASDEILVDTVVELPASLMFQNLDVFDVVFTPPNPYVFVNGIRGFSDGVITLAVRDSDALARIRVTYAGQISAE